MKNNNAIDTLICILKKKNIYIILIACITAVILSGIKVLFSDVATRTGDYLFIRTIQFEQHDNSEIRDIKDNFDYKNYLESSSNYYQLIKSVKDDEFDFTKVDSAWKRKSETEQIEWLKKHIQVNNYEGGVVSVTLRFDPNVNRDVNYIKEHGDLLLDAFLIQNDKSIQSVIPNMTSKIIDKEMMVPVVTPIDRKSIFVKFAVIGFIIGLIFSIIGFYAMEISRKRQ